MHRRSLFSLLSLVLAFGCGDDDDRGMDAGPGADGGMPDGMVILPDGDLPDAGPPGDGGLPPSTDLFAPPTITTCPGDALPSLPDAVCEVTSGAGSATLMTGDVLTPGEVFRGGQVAFDGSGVITCVGCDCADAAGADATTIVCPDGVVSPGLINGHDHITFDNGEPYATTGQQTEERYEHRHDWRRGLDGHFRINSRGGRARTEEMQWVELRQLMAGTTAINGSGGPEGLLRNLDSPSRQEGFSNPDADYSTFPLGDSDGAKLTGNCNYEFSDTAADIADENAYVPHMSEGIDEAARNEFRCSLEGDTRLVEAQTAIIHGVGLKVEDLGEMAAAGAKLIWSPRTNITLYGDTARVTEYARLGITIGLGTDWIATGSMNMLRELQCADGFNADHLGGFFPDEQLWLMATRNTADALGFGDLTGTLEVGLAADIAIFDARERSDHRAVIGARPADVALVLRGGDVFYGDSAVVSALSDACESAGDICGPSGVCGAAKHVCLGELGTTLSALAAENTEMYELCFCGEVEFEPTCEPSRNHMGAMFPDAMVDGSNYYTGMSSADDMDGDGIPNADDNCMGIFNPIRPLDDGMQADFDMDGIGDACDACPLGNDDTPEDCIAFDPSDRDGDGVPNDMDNCPGDPNEDQSDMDDDEKGDVCDACPLDANPGSAGCPATVYELQTDEFESGSRVSVSGLVVTAVTGRSFYAQQDPDSDDYDGVDNSGILVFTGDTPSVSRGDRVDITAGTYEDFFGIAELTDPTVVVNSSGDDVDALVLAATEAAGARAEALESVLIQIDDASVTESPVEPPDDRDSESLFEVDDALNVGDALFAVTASTGDGFSLLRGILAFDFGAFRLRPRDAADAVPTGLRISPTDAMVRLGATQMFMVQIPTPAPAGGTMATLTWAPTTLFESGPTVMVPIAEGETIGTVELTAADSEMTGSVTATWMTEDPVVATVTLIDFAADGIFFSEYIEPGGGRAEQKVLEIFNGTGAAIDMSTCRVDRYTNGSPSSSADVVLSGSLAAGDVYLVCNSGLDDSMPDLCDVYSGVVNHNGDDAFSLTCMGEVVDTFGRIGEDPGDEWAGGGVSTRDTVLRRKCSVSMGDTVGDDAFDPSVEWDAFAEPDLSGLGEHCE